MKNWYNKDRNYLSFEDYIETVDNAIDRSRISRAYAVAARLFDEEDINFAITQKARESYIRFNIENNDIYRSGGKLKGMLQYNIRKNNFVDWNTNQIIGVEELELYGDKPNEIYDHAEYFQHSDFYEQGRRDSYGIWDHDGLTK